MVEAPRPWSAWRAIALGVLLMPVLVAWNYHIEAVFYCFATYAAPFFNVVCVIFLLASANLALVRWLPRFALRKGELIIVYIMLSLQGALCSHNMMEILITLLPHPWKYATPENKWGELFLERLPKWAMVPEPAVFEDYYLGNSTYWTKLHLLGWLRPALVWSTFIAVLLCTMLCLNLILRRRWIGHERLSYPVLQLPLAVIDRPQSLFSTRLLWAGFVTAALLALVAGLHELFPAVPQVPVGRYGMAALFPTGPWRVLRGMRWAIYPWAIGIGFLIPLDLAVACWLCYFAYCGERVLGQWLGWNSAGGFPWAEDQALGAYFGILAMGLWVGREHFVGVLRSALRPWRRAETGDDRTYRWAVWGAVAGFSWLCWFAVKIGFEAWVAVVFFAIYFALATMMTRIRAELGFPTHDMHNMSPPHALTRLFSPLSYKPNTLVGFTLFWWFNRTYASHPMPHQLEAYKMAEVTHSDSRGVTLAMVVAAVLGPWFVFLLVPHFYYQLGSATGHVNQWGTDFGHGGFGMLEGWLRSPQRFDPSHLAATAAGFGVALVLGAVRVRLIGWPIHPLAYAIANSWGVEQLWLPLIIASGIKWAMLRYGGLAVYRRWIPYFLGLTLGDFVAGSIWNWVGMIGHFHPYDFWPGLIK